MVAATNEKNRRAIAKGVYPSRIKMKQNTYCSKKNGVVKISSIYYG